MKGKENTVDNILNLSSAENYAALACQKLDEELKSFKGGQKETAVSKHVASTLTHFCEQDVRFAKVVYQTKRTLSDCCAEIMKGCGQHISDIDVYRGAVRNYFPNADVTFHMTISITGEAPSEEEMSRVPKKEEPKKKAEPKKAPQKAPQKAAEEPKQKEAPAPKPTPKPAPTAKETGKAKAKKREPEIIQLSLF